MDIKSSPPIAILLILIGLGGLLFITYDSPGYMKPFYGSDLKTGFQSNGEQIYYTGYNDRGERIKPMEGPAWLYMHGGSCVDCHGVNGRGGVPVMMATEIPTDITYASLSSETGHGEDEHPPYTNETIKIAIIDGIDPAGNPLDLTMPRWEMSERDLEDLLGYLKTL